MEQPKKTKKWLWPVLGGACLAVGLLFYALDIPHIQVEKGDGHLSIIIGTPPLEKESTAPNESLPTQDMQNSAIPEKTNSDPLLGLSVGDIPLKARLFYRLPAGPCVTGVDPQSDCGKKGIRAGDIVTGLAGHPTATVEELIFARNLYGAGDMVTLHIFRAGEHLEFLVRLGALDGKE
ncbi:MAG: PDZ domain-containing protein [Oscillospiraceae bacterium]|nr:PDZ domain-containing protein [Oscillospiraceae bacterium]